MLTPARRPLLMSADSVVFGVRQGEVLRAGHDEPAVTFAVDSLVVEHGHEVLLVPAEVAAGALEEIGWLVEAP